MARTKASTHRDTTGRYTSVSDSEDSEDEHEEPLDATGNSTSNVHPADSHSSQTQDAPHGDDSLVSHADEHPADTDLVDDPEDDEPDDEDSESDDEDDEEEEETGSQRARSRSVSSRASPILEFPDTVIDDQREPMEIDPPATDAHSSHTDGDPPILAETTPSGLAMRGGRQGIDETPSPLTSPAKVTDSPPKTPPAGEPSVAAADNVKKSKIKRPKPPPSPEPQLPPPRPPIETIRLSFALQGPENYEVNVAEESRQAGLLPALPIPVITVGDTEESAEEGLAPVKGSKKRKRNADTYDTADPFIDDSLLDQDERKYIAQTKQTGFYVSSGEVALLKEATPKKSHKPKSTAQGSGEGADGDKAAAKKKTKPLPLTAAGLLALPLPGKERPPAGNGTVDSPIDLSSANPPPLTDSSAEMEYDPGPEVGKKRKRYIYVGGPGTVEGGKRRKVVDITSFHPSLHASMKKLEDAIAKQDWSNKAKFPPDLKPLLTEVAIQAIQLDEYDDDFFALMPTIFPYNKFTMTKLIKRTIFPDHIRLLNERQEALLAELKSQAEEGFLRAEEEHNRSVMLWEKRQEKVHPQGDESAPTANGSDGVITRPHTPPAEDGDDPMDGTGGDGAAAPLSSALKRDQNPPQKKYRLTESMRAIIWELVLLTNECVRLENEKNTLENSVMVVSDQAARKNLYQKIVAAFPEGWMTSGQISRDVSAIKKKLEREHGISPDHPQPQS